MTWCHHLFDRYCTSQDLYQNQEGTRLTWHTIIAPSCSNTSENTSLNLWGYRWYCWRIGVLILSYSYERWLQRVVNTRMYCVLFEQGLRKAQGKSRKVSTAGLYVWTQHWECMTNGEKLQEVHASKPCYLACTNGYLNNIPDLGHSHFMVKFLPNNLTDST